MIDIERGGREKIWVINRLAKREAKREVLYDSIANCREYCIVCDMSGIGANAVRGGCSYHLLCLYE